MSMLDQPLVSVIMNCYNGERYLREAIDSVYSQTYENWEIIFWDNASTDGSAKIAQSYDGKLKYFSAKQNVSLYQARNLAIDKCGGHYVAFLDSDDYWHESKIQKQLECFEEHPTAGLIATNVHKTSGNLCSRSLFKPDGSVVKRTQQDLMNRYDIVISSVMIKRAVLKLSGGFDESFPLTGDKELFMRLAFSEHLLVMHDDLATVRIHGESLTSQEFMNFSNENIYLLLKLIGDNSEYFKVNFQELVSMIKKIHFQKAVASWKNGDSPTARHWLTSTVGVKHFLMYLITWLPHRFYGLFDRIYRFLN
jgi:glycosyltransferase involved in cell wall biosynthesis